MEKSYILNLKTQMLHHINGCYHSQRMKPENIRYYYTIEEARAEARAKYSFDIDLCENCFEKEK